MFTKLQQIRNYLNDPIKTGLDKQFGDGNATYFEFNHKRVYPGSVRIEVANDLITTDKYTVNYDEGFITFSFPPGLGAEVSVEYTYSIFLDDEITSYLEQTGDSVDATMVELIKILLFDSARRFDYETANAKMKPSQVFKNLKDLLQLFKDGMLDTDNGSGVGMINRTDSRFYKKANDKPIDLSRLD